MRDDLVERLKAYEPWGVADCDRPLLQEAATRIAALEERVRVLEGALDKHAYRFEQCADMIAESHAISGTLRAERTIKAKHYALEARALGEQP